MRTITTEQTARCIAYSRDGQRFTIIRLTTFEDLSYAPGTGRQPQKIDTGKELQTSDGLFVEWVGKGRYWIPDLKLEVVSDDPNAP